MSKRLKQRNAYKGNATKVVNSLKTSNDCDLLKTGLNKLNSYHNRILELNDGILTEMEADADIDKEIAESASYDDQILGVISSISNKIDNLSKPQPSHASSSGAGSDPPSSKSQSKSANVKLPKLEISKFSGDPMRWREFWDSFVNTIDTNSELADVDKFKYLKGYLEGDALRLCEGYTLTAANYESVKTTLGDRFGNPQLAIFSHLTALIEQPTASHSVKSLQAIYDESERHIRSLVSLGLKEEEYGLVFTPIILSKLPLHVKMELHRQNGADPWSLAKLRDLLKQEIHARDMSERHFGTAKPERAPEKPGDSHKGTNSKPPWSKSTGAMLPTTPGRRSGSWQGPSRSGLRACSYCDDPSHRSDQCKKYPDYPSRRQKLGKACINCLSPNHLVKECKSKGNCHHCQKQGHHSSLCFSLFRASQGGGASTMGGSGSSNGPQGTRFGSGGSGAPPSHLQHSGTIAGTPGTNPHATPFTPTTNTSVLGFSDKRYTNMQTALASCSGSGGGGDSTFRLLFETAGFRSYITSDAAHQLGAEKIGQESLSLGVFEGKKRRNRTYDVVEFFVHAQGGERIPIHANVTDFISCPVLSQPFDSLVNPSVHKFQLAEPPSTTVRELPIDVLIGGDHYYDIVTTEQIRFSDGLVLLSSKLGYLVAGASKLAPTPPASLSAVTLLSTSASTDREVDLERLWRLEHVGIKDELSSPDDEAALSQFNSTMQFTAGRYFVTWPRKDNAPELPENRELALGRLRSLLKRTSPHPEILQKYDAVIRDQLDRGIIEVAPVEPSGQVHYLPHHCVLKPQSPTTPVRVVYDASARARATSLSLNDTLYTGPLFLANLVGLLFRFRLDPVAVVSDIEKAYLQIGLQESARDLVRFFWVRDPNLPFCRDNLVVYRFASVPFGIVCSAFLLGACLLHHFSLRCGFVPKLLAESLYVDNIIVSRPCLDSAISHYQEAKQILSDASMNLRQWYTNSDQLLKQISTVDRGSGAGVTSVLGMVWDTITDTLQCPAFSLSPSSVTTKRQLTQFVAKVPCGFFSPVTASGKLLIQRSWISGVGWVEKLPDDILHDWGVVGPSILAIPNHRIPRFAAALSSSQDVSVHCFCDASTKCYAAVLYILSSSERPALLYSRSKLAPLKSNSSRSGKPLTVPQLELMAVWIGTRIVKFFCDQLKLFDVPRFVWTDSQCVLHWVTHKKVTTVFVKNRVKEIHKLPNVSFRYVKSEENPADLPSRGCTLDVLATSSLWWHGPSWLSSGSDAWPHLPDSMLRLSFGRQRFVRLSPRVSPSRAVHYLCLRHFVLPQHRKIF